jgi:hypothetical protein
MDRKPKCNVWELINTNYFDRIGSLSEALSLFLNAQEMGEKVDHHNWNTVIETTVLNITGVHTWQPAYTVIFCN